MTHVHYSDYNPGTDHVLGPHSADDRGDIKADPDRDCGSQTLLSVNHQSTSGLGDDKYWIRVVSFIYLYRGLSDTT